MNPAAIEIEGLVIEHGHGVRTVDRVSLELLTGEILVLAGPSGAGKSTLLRALLGFATPTAGGIRLAGRLVSDGAVALVPPEERGLGVVFQDLALWPHLDVADNVGFALAVRRVARDERRQRVREVLRRVGLEHRARSRPDELSGGERQRVAIARAIVTDPSAVLLDEPLSSLDVLLQRELLAFLRELFQTRGNSVLYVTHDPREAFAIADRIAIMEGGRITYVGSPANLAQAAATPFARAFAPESSKP